jgi:hypothetical protein
MIIAILAVLFILLILFFLFKKSSFGAVNDNLIAIVSMIKNPKNIKTWLDYHRNLGISHFYIQLEDTPDLIDYLKLQPDVTLNVNNSTGVNEYTEIQTRQNKWVNEALKLAEKDNMTWLIHIDSDELIDGDLSMIRRLPDDVDTFWFQNHEAVYADVPTEEDSCFSAVKFLNCENEYCVSYVNGKSGGRVSKDVSAYGPHRFQSNIGSEVKLPIILKHFESCDFDVYKNKFKHLAKKADKSEIPFPYYKESIDAANNDSDEELKDVFRKYRTVKNASLR